MMLRIISIFTFTLLLLIIYGCGQSTVSETTCSPSWFESVELKVATGDGLGHGPDIGSMEWRSVVEFKLGIRGSSNMPDRETSEWCGFIDALVFNEENLRVVEKGT